MTDKEDIIVQAYSLLPATWILLIHIIVRLDRFVSEGGGDGNNSAAKNGGTHTQDLSWARRSPRAPFFSNVAITSFLSSSKFPDGRPVGVWAAGDDASLTVTIVYHSAIGIDILPGIDNNVLEEL